VRITRRLEFCASHRLCRADWSDEQNRDAFGERAGRKERGHNYTLEVTLRGPADPETGMLMDLKALKGVLEREVEGRFDHRNLNLDTPCFRDRAPTAENFAWVLFEILDGALPPGLLERVRLSPTEDLIVEATR
jgi:6-pyruvoyltetrahydropterin/6-carboxytetrahydropterin synthase